MAPILGTVKSSYIPLMIRLPGARGAGRRDDRASSLLDVMPTLLGLVGGGSNTERFEGQVLLDSTGRGSADAPPWSFSGAVADDSRMVSIQDREYNLIWEYPNGHMRLYNLEDDPDETVNLASGAPWPSQPNSPRTERVCSQPCVSGHTGMPAVK